MNRNLYNAAISGDVLFLRHLAAVSPQLLMTEVPQEQQTALHIAARSGHMEFVREILRLCGGSLAIKQNNQGDTALHCAARNGEIGVIRILIVNAPSFEGEREAGGLLRMRNKQGNTALHEALIHGHDEVALRLLETDPKLAILPNSNVQTSLHLAARGALFEVVKKILAGLVVLEEKIEVVKKRDNAGRTALHYAAYAAEREKDAAGREKEEIVALLLKTDSSIAYDLDEHGLSPLHIAAASGSIETIIELIKHCPDAMEQRDPMGRNAFHISILNRLKFGNLERLKATVNEHKKIVNEPNAEGNTPLHLAAKFVCYPLVKELLNLGNAKLNVRNNDGLTPLDLAESARVHHLALADAVVRVLEDHGGCSGETWEEPYISDGTVRKNEKASEQVTTAYGVALALIATVSFTAAFTVPGDYKDDGTPTLGKNVAFQAFMIFNTIAMCSSIAAGVCLIWENRGNLQGEIWGVDVWAANLSIIAYVAMVVSFVTGVCATLAPVTLTVAILICLIALSPFVVHIALYISVIRNKTPNQLWIGRIFQKCHHVWIRKAMY